MVRAGLGTSFKQAMQKSSGSAIIAPYKRDMIEPSRPWLPKGPKPQRSGLFLVMVTVGGLMIGILYQTIY